MLLSAWKKEQLAELFSHKRRRGLSLLVMDRDTDSLAGRLRQSGAHAELLAEVKAEASRMLAESDPELTYSLFRIFQDSGERLSYERLYFEKRKRLNAFAIMAWLEPESAEYAEALHQTIWSICGEVTWCLPAHYKVEAGSSNIDLFAAETGFALSELLVLMGEKMPILLRKFIADEVERRLFQPFLEKGPYSWEKLANNWSAVCAGSIGAAALHLIDDEAKLAAVLERVLAALDCFLSGYGDDGACAEGYLYWQYGFGYYVYFTALLKAATDGQVDGFASDKVKEIALFQQRCFSSGSTVINFSDSLQECGVFMGLSCYLHEVYGEVVVPDAALRAGFASDHCGRWAPAIRNLLWFSGEQAGVGSATAGGDVNIDEGAVQDAAPDKLMWPSDSHYMQDVQWLLSRYVTQSGATYCFAAKGGHNAEPHNHNDLGHFILHADGDVYLADLGSGMYTADYFGAERYSYWCNGSQGHSVPIVGGEYQAAGASFYAVVKNVALGAAMDRFELELGAAYARDDLLRLERSFEWSKAGLPCLTVSDRIVMAATAGSSGGDDGCGGDNDGGSGEDGLGDAEGAAVIERFITLLKPSLRDDGEVVVQGKQLLRITYDKQHWVPEIKVRSDIDHFGRERVWYTLDFRARFGCSAEGIEAKFSFQFDQE